MKNKTEKLQIDPREGAREAKTNNDITLVGSHKSLKIALFANLSEMQFHLRCF